MHRVPEGQSAPGGLELQADYWRLLGSAPPGGIDTVLTSGSEIDLQLDNRHLMIRGENTSKILRLVSIVAKAFRAHYEDRGYTEVS
ncbi:unnamed protein product [Protopolystoma xenopodis]|uniref:Uncharacterized protein n=1 Tax=Protopolystoma xenopodis TaxID=117903 RepID=A0A448WXX8_9PLAT|nr:unnamed protein product [Protopolystoma xenopodis]